MLVLTRQKHQTIVIGGETPITVTVTEIRGGRIRLAIDAPREIEIRRGELAEAPAGASTCGTFN